MAAAAMACVLLQFGLTRSALFFCIAKEADVSLPVVRRFVKRVEEAAIGVKVRLNCSARFRVGSSPRELSGTRKVRTASLRPGGSRFHIIRPSVIVYRSLQA